jgi:hypothetical protein
VSSHAGMVVRRIRGVGRGERRRSTCFHIEHPRPGIVSNGSVWSVEDSMGITVYPSIASNGSAWLRTSATSVGKESVERYDAWRHVANVLLMCC